jgi:quercetin dioxygenase-like cupin family protein
MEIKRIGSQPSGKDPVDWFTGTVRLDPLFDRSDPARVSGASVTFEPGARTAWHTRPLGQTLIVTAGCGWAQREGGPVEEISPGEKHWHGATATTAMTHRHSGEARRHGRGLDGKGQRRTVPQGIARPKPRSPGPSAVTPIAARDRHRWPQSNLTRPDSRCGIYTIDPSRLNWSCSNGASGIPVELATSFLNEVRWWIGTNLRWC